MTGPTGLTRRRAEAVALSVLVVLAAAFLVWRVVDNPAPALHPADASYDASPARVGGSYVDTATAAETTRHASLRLPTGTVHISVGRPTTGVQTVSDSEPVTAPAGGSFVSVSVSQDTSTAVVPVDSVGSPSVSTAVVAGGRRYTFARGGDVAANTVAIAGRPASVSVELTYAGVSQRVDMSTGKVSPGPVAAPLYRPAPAGTQSCGAASLAAPYSATGATYPLTCTVSWRQVPFAPGRGWARAGSAWTLLSITTNGPGAVLRSGSRQYVYQGEGVLTVVCGDGSAAADLDSEAQFRNRDDVSLLTCPASSGAVSISERLETLDTSPFEARWSVGLR